MADTKSQPKPQPRPQNVPNRDSVGTYSDDRTYTPTIKK